MVFSVVRRLINYVDKDKKQAIEKLLQEYGVSDENSQIDFSCEDEIKAYLKTDAVTENEKQGVIYYK